MVSALLLTALPSVAGQITRDVKINILLSKDGTARVTEVWDVVAESGTELYLVRDNLGDIVVGDLEVRDETGRQYIFEDNWDIDRSLAQKAYRCGIVRRSGGGCELCWGLGSYGSHVYTATYNMTNAVKSLTDYDVLHLQVLSDGIQPPVQHVSVSVSYPENDLEGDPVRCWGFGFSGQIGLEGDSVVAESYGPLSSDSSVILLIRFDKGIFAPTSISSKSFEDIQKKAFKGSDYKSEGLGDLVATVAAIFITLIAMVSSLNVRRRKRVFGVNKLSKIDWCRDVPFSGNIFETDYVMDKADPGRKPNAIASAIILRMLENNNLSSATDSKGRIEISFNDNADSSWMNPIETELYNMMKMASGSDVILQNKEFSRWSARNQRLVSDWAEKAKAEGSSALLSAGMMSPSGKFSEEGKKKACEAYGFKKFLSDFTLSSERKSAEVGLWREYLVFAALFGIADQVSKELKDINPQILQDVVPGCDPTMYYRLVRSGNLLADSITNATFQQRAQQMRASGMGGSTSFGGGGGFSGGGYGGGIR